MTTQHEANDEIVTVSHVVPKSGRTDEFIGIQTGFQKSVAGRIEGLLGGRLLYAEDGRSLVIMSRFKSREDLANWTRSDLFADHMARVKPLLETTSPQLFSALWRSGDV